MRIRLFLALTLSLVLGLVSGTIAVARVHAVGMTEVTICSGYGVVTVTLDAEGNPTGPVHPCPDCLSGVGLAVMPDLPLLRPPVARAVSVPVARMAAAAPQVLVPPQARGPPWVI